MSEIEKIKEQQRKWAEKNNIPLDKQGYVKEIENNFQGTLSKCSRKDFQSGDGNELDKKIRAIHSSSALVCNVFEYWRHKDKTLLSNALGFEKRDIKSLVFEQKLSMGMKGSMPNIDVFLIMDDGQAVGIESKFTESMSKQSNSKLFQDSYFPSNNKRWQEVGLPNCQKLAEDVNSNNESFIYLNVSQLLKHALGLATMHSHRSILMYLYYEILDLNIRKDHNDDLEKFAKKLNGELSFKKLTYQDMFNSLKKGNSENNYSKYIRYLENRYFTN